VGVFLNQLFKFWFYDHPIGQYDHPKQLVTFRWVSETKEPVWYWHCAKLKSRNCAHLDAIEVHSKVSRNFCPFLLAYDLGHRLFASIKNGFELGTIVGPMWISKQLDRQRWYRQQQRTQDNYKVTHKKRRNETMTILFVSGAMLDALFDSNRLPQSRSGLCLPIILRGG
jgi:hypothetical protein